MSSRLSLKPSADPLSSFLSGCGWGGIAPEPVNEDSSPRRYFRLRRGDQSVILMESAPDGSPAAIPGHSVRDFIRIGAWLRNVGLHAPEILDANEKQGFLLLEDLGDVSFRMALGQGVPAAETYGLAVDVLIRLRGSACTLDLPFYYNSHVHTGRRRIVDWYMPMVLRAKNPDGLAEEYLSVWDSIEKKLPPCPQGFLHIDYHVENLMWLPGEAGLARCGLLDFQGAMRGPLPYDLANLLEDARIDVPADLRRAAMDRYCGGMERKDREVFESWYRVLATQFHCRLMGQFIRLAVKSGKTRYLEYLPRLGRYLEEGLEHPLLEPLKAWFGRAGVDFAARPEIDAAYVRPDAF